MARRKRPRRPFHYEGHFWKRGVRRVAGVDEVGRAPLAGPVVAAAVILHRDVGIPGAVDSKRLLPREREELSAEILEAALAVGVGAASVREIDRLNILRASGLAMRRAIAQLRDRPDHVVVDGTPVRNLGCRHDAVVGGDDRIHTVACASIVAKVCRDRLMKRLSRRYPGYGWETNVGYPTREHRDAIRSLGPTPHHRMSFGLFQLELELEAETATGEERGADDFHHPSGSEPCTPST